MVEIRSKKALAMVLSRLKGFTSPKVKLEQYITEPEIAAEVLWSAKMSSHVGKVSVDLGCGTGMLGVGLLLLGAEKVIFVDSDDKSLDVCRSNLDFIKNEYSGIGDSVLSCQDISDFNTKVDLVVQNPPFGTKVRHNDREFLIKAFNVSDLVYSFHKSETKQYILDLSKRKGFIVENYWNFRFPLKATYGFHVKKLKYIDVSCFCFTKSKDI